MIAYYFKVSEIEDVEGDHKEMYQNFKISNLDF